MNLKQDPPDGQQLFTKWHHHISRKIQIFAKLLGEPNMQARLTQHFLQQPQSILEQIHFRTNNNKTLNIYM
jgi:hypothetical protein